ncbi:MAG: glycosyltransferase [Clostridiales bacterium]|nr:glycosyltransferase [Clostridiales bacterium]
MVKISIIMPCYNTDKYVGEALDSIICQNFPDVEIICINDGSGDRTLEVLQSYANRFDNISVYSSSNHGQGYQRNFGIDHASGKYVYFMDSDDKLKNGSLSRMYEQAEKDSLDILYFEGESFYESEELEDEFPQYKTLYHRREQFTDVRSGEELYIAFENAGQFIVSPCLQFTRYEHIKKNNLAFPSISALEDNLFAMKSILSAERVACIPDALYLRRIRNDSTMTAPLKADRLDAYWIITLEFMKILQQYRDNPEMEKAIFQRILRFSGNIDKTYNALQEKSVSQNTGSMFTEEQTFLYLMQYCLRTGNQIYRKEKQASQKRLNQTYAEKSEITAKLQKTYEEKSEINAKLQKTYEEKSEINARLQKTYAEKSEITAKLQKAYVENSKITAALKKTESKNQSLTNKLKKTRNEKQKLEKKILKLQKELTELKGHFLVRIDRKLRNIWRRFKRKIKK